MEPVSKRAKPHECRTCSSVLVQPLDWVRLEDRWQVLVRCPECETSYAVYLDQEDVNEFSYNLEAGFQCLLEAMEQLDQEIFLKECETFIAAVRAGQIFPMDF